MELPVHCISGSCEVRSVIRILTAESIPTPAKYTRLKNVYGDSVMPLHTVHSWVRKFKEEKWENVHKEQSGRPNKASIEETRCAVLHILEEDRRYTICEITKQLVDVHCITVSHMTVQHILTNEGFTKICARSVPKLPTNTNKQARLEAQLDTANKFLRQYLDDPSMLDRIVTGDNSWVLYVTPCLKEDTKVWHKKGEPLPKKCRLDRSTKKILCTPFRDSKGVLCVHFAKGGKTGWMNSAMYVDIPYTLKKRIKGKRPGVLRAGVILQHNNATLHKPQMTEKKIEDVLWEVFMHTANSSFSHLSSQLWRNFWARNGSQTTRSWRRLTIYQCTKDVGTQFYTDGINKLVHRYEKCVQVGGDYVEK